METFCLNTFSVNILNTRKFNLFVHKKINSCINLHEFKFRVHLLYIRNITMCINNM